MKFSKTIFTVFVILILAACNEVVIDDLSDKEVVLRAPVDGFSSNDGMLSFWWDEVDQATEYRIQIAEPDFTNTNRLIIDSTVSSTQLALNIPTGTYQWQVRAQNSAFATSYTNSSFTVQ